MATQGQDGGGTVYLRAGLDVSGVELGAQQAKAAVKDMATSVVNDTTAAGKSIANIGGASPNFDRLNTAFSGVSDSVKKMVSESDRGLKAFINQIQNTAAGAGNVTQAIADKFEARAVLKGFDPAVVQPYIEGLRKLAAENKAVAEVAAYEAGEQKKATAERQRAAAELANFARSAQTARAELLSLGKTTAEKFQIKAELLGLDKNAATQKIIADLKEAQAVADSAAATMGNKLVPATNAAGMSAKAYSAALRQVPAQLTDIVVSLQGGQAPMTVLLQQGGQLKDVFGGVGAAARAMGGYILSLINPFTVLAAAAGTLAFAYKSGSDEASAFNKALVLSGNQAGVTAGSLAFMAQSISAVSGTTGAAADALAQFAQSGAVGAANMQKFTAAALAFEKYTGAAIKDTIAEFKKLSEEPLKASIKLNESTNFLTVSLYEQIKALEQQGKTIEAADLAQNAFADTLKNRADEAAKNIGIIERSWLGVKAAVLGAWDAIKGVGRNEPVAKQVADKAGEIAILEAHRQNQRGGLSVLDEARLKKLNEELAVLNKIALREQNRATDAAQQALEVANRTAADKIRESLLTKQEKMEREIAQTRTALVRDGASQLEIEKAILAVREKYAEKGKSAKEDAYGLNRDQGAAYLKYITDFQKDSEKATKELDHLTDGQSKLLTMIQDPLFQQMPETWRQTALEAAYAAIATEQAAAAQSEFEKAIKAQTAARDAELKKVEESAASTMKKAQAIEDEVALYGKSEEAIKNLTIARLREEQAKQMSYGDEKMVQAIEDEIAAIKRLAKAKDALDDKTAARKAAEQAVADWKRAAERIESTITDALMRGFEAGKGFAENLRDAVVNLFKTMVLRPVVEMSVRGGMSVLGLGGAAGSASAAEILGNVGNAGSAMNGLSQLGGMSGWLTDFGTSAANGIIKAGELAYQAGFEKIGSSMMSLSEAGNFSTVANGLNMVGNGLGYLNAAVAASEGKWGQAAGSAIGTYFGGPIGAAIGGAVGGWLDNAFGGGHEYTTGTGISGKFSGSSFSGRNYQDWRNDGSSGIFGIGASGSSSGTNYSAMSSAMQKSLGTAFGALVTQTAGFAASLGASTDTITGFQKDIKLSLGSDAEANKKAIADMFKGLANEVAATVLDPQYIREGEGAADTLARLSTNLAAVNGALDTLGDNLLGVSQYGGDAASALVDAFGGLQAYQSAIGTYYQNFYSAEERAAKTREQLAKQLAAVGQSVPATADAYRQLVNAQDLTTDSGRKAYAVLISLSSAFASVTSAVDELQTSSVSAAESLKTLIDALQTERTKVASAVNDINPAPVMTAADIAAAILSAKIESPKLDAVSAATTTYDSAKAATASALELAALTSTAANNLSSAQSSYNTAMSALAGATNTLASTPTQIWEHYVYNTLFGDRGGDRLVSNPAYASAVAARNAAQAKADAAAQSYAAAQVTYGPTAAQDPAAQTALQTAYSVEAAAKQALVNSQVAYNEAVKAYAVDAAKSITVLGKLREETVRYYEAQKALAETMTASATNLRNAITAARESQLDSQQLAQKRLADYGSAYSMALSTTGYAQVGYADKMTALLPQIATSLQDSASSATDWASAVGVLFAQADNIASQLEANSPKNYQEESLSLLDSIDTLLGNIGSTTQVIVDAVKGGAGLTATGLREVVKALGGTPTFATGGYHAGGLRLVGENGPELEVTGPSRIFNAAQTADIMRGGSQGMSSAELVAMRLLLADLRDGQAQTASIMQRMVRINEKWDGDGLPTTRSETA